MWSSFYLDDWWWLFFCNLYLFGFGVFIVFFIHFPKIDYHDDEKYQGRLKKCLYRIFIFVLMFLEIFDVYSDYLYFDTFMHHNSYITYFLFLTLIAPFILALGVNFNKPSWILRTFI